MVRVYIAFYAIMLRSYSVHGHNASPELQFFG